MLILKRVLVGFVVILVALLCVGFLLPRQVHVERSATIDAPVAAVFAEVNDLRQWERWTPWSKDLDPTVELTYGDPTAGKGAWYTWTSKKFGAGKLEIVDSQPGKSIEMLLMFEGSAGGPAKCGFTFVPSDGKTNVTWYFDADMGVWPPGRYFGLFMDRLLGADFEKGLAKLKTISEQEAKKTPVIDIEAAFRKHNRWGPHELEESALDEIQSAAQEASLGPWK
ncbi:MAG: SRPBCC family protein [Pirellulales bacterium]